MLQHKLQQQCTKSKQEQVLGGSSLPATLLDIPSISVLLYQDGFSWQAETGTT